MRRIAPFLLVLALWAAAAARDRFDAWIAAAALPPLVAATSVEVLDREGALLRAYTVADGRWRLAVAPGEVDPVYLRMLLAYEDRRFRDHPGIDARALLRAAWQAARAGRVVSGGSTLTMQVARLVEDGGTGRWAGKLRQLRLALALERRLTKDEILGLYLNRAPFGGNLEGVRAAARAWFGKEPRRLTPAEAALLVALPQSPEARRPDRDPAAARAARDRVLARMVAAGVLPAAEAEAAAREAVPVARRDFPALAAHLADRARAAAPGQGVLRLTVDGALQARLEALAAAAVRGRGGRLSAAILVLDHRTGEVLASVGSAGYTDAGREGYVDMTQAVRSPGSTLKPLVYGLAFDEGLAQPETLIEDRPAAFGRYRPQNFDGGFRGTVTVRQALQLSLNVPVVALTEALGPERLIAHMRRAGAAPALPGDGTAGGGAPGLAVALGGVGVTLEDLARLYAALARGGVPVGLKWSLDAAAAAPASAPVLSPEAAWQVADILAGVPPPAGRPAWRLPYKTGTSYGHRDAWAVGFDGRHVVAVWLGRPDGTPVPGAFGAEVAAPVLFDAFRRLKPAPAPLPPPPPATLIAATGALPAPLQRFRGREALFAAPEAAPRVAFPPDGAEVETGGVLVLKVERGTPPFTWLADGRPVAVASHERQEVVEGVGPGFVTLSVIDAEGRSAGATVRLR
jgi:penicillin-binding protein 1C